MSTAEEKGGWTRLHSLCFKREDYGQETFFWRAERLSRKYGIDCRTNLGNTPLHFACSNPGFADLALFLLSKGADPTLRNHDGETALHHACIHSTPEVVEALVRCPRVNVDVQDENECTPLHWTLQQSEFPVGVVRLLLLAGARVDSRDDIGDTPMHYAAREGYFDIYDLLRAAHRGANPYNALGLTPFHAACETDQAEFVRKFVEKYPVDARGRSIGSLSTGLHLAVQAAAVDSVAVLLASDVGAFHLEAMDASGKTPFVWAFLLELPEVMAQLEDAGARCDVVTSVAIYNAKPPLYGDSDSESSDNDEWDTDSWAVVTPVRGRSVACAAGSDQSKHSSSDEGNERCSPLRNAYDEDFTLGLFDLDSCP